MSLTKLSLGGKNLNYSRLGRVWYLHLKKNLLKLGFKPSQHDECVFYYGKTIFIVYTDDTILLGPDKEEIDQLVEKLGKTFKIEDQGKPGVPCKYPLYFLSLILSILYSFQELPIICGITLEKYSTRILTHTVPQIHTVISS